MEITLARSEKFGPWAQAAHWVLAGLMIFLMIDGTRLGDVALPARAGMLQLHAGLGLLTMLLAGAAITWRLLRAGPSYPQAMSRVEQQIAKTVAWTLYGMALVQPATGMIHAATYVNADILAFGVVNLSALAPQNAAVTNFFHAIHALGFIVLYLLIALHVAAAFKHALLEQHEIPWRMMPSVIARPLRLAMARLYRILS